MAGSHRDEPADTTGLVAVSPKAKPGYASQTPTMHWSLVKAVQGLFGLQPLLRKAGDPTTNDVSDLFTTFP